MIGDVTSAAIHSAMSNLMLRQRVSADNIANINTPKYLAGRVNFEDSLGAALNNGSANAAPQVTRSMEPTRLDGNNVNLDDETIIMTETNLKYSTMVEALNNKYRMLRSAVGR